ncbi:MAG: hypothetical protein KBT03_00780 [Bacteroidales bacterium]|nr:hypothetical protein [Candidatus Scybalousia scybalohippi]
MSVGIWNAVEQKLEKIAGKVNLNDSSTSEEHTWSSKKISDSLVDIKDDLDEFEEKVTFEGGASKTRFGVNNGNAYSDIVDGTETHRLVMSKDEQKVVYNHYTGTTLDKAFELATMDKVASAVIRQVVSFDNVEVSANSTLQLLKDCVFNGYTPLMINAQVWSNTDEIIVSGSYVSSDNKAVILLRNTGDTADTTTNIVCTVLYARNA